VSLENRGRVVYHCFDYHDNLCQTDVEVAVAEAKLFRYAGAHDLRRVQRGLGRDTRALYRIAVDTGLHIIMGSALYVASSWTEEEKKRSPRTSRRSCWRVPGRHRPDEDQARGAGGGGDLGHPQPHEVKSLQGSALARRRSAARS